MELLRVHRTQALEGAGDVINVLHGFIQPTHHNLAVGGHLRVPGDGGIAGQSLGPNCSRVELSPQADDCSALTISSRPGHVYGSKVSSHFREK
uniref:Uncharacterized protein n=1 Tax=Monopterus albus TaxID=43700 RepID=A0A3Q3Q846_MONAL